MTEPTYITLDELDRFGDLDSLPFPLDAPIWNDREAALALLAAIQGPASPESSPQDPVACA